GREMLRVAANRGDSAAGPGCAGDSKNPVWQCGSSVEDVAPLLLPGQIFQKYALDQPAAYYARIFLAENAGWQDAAAGARVRLLIVLLDDRAQQSGPFLELLGDDRRLLGVAADHLQLRFDSLALRRERNGCALGAFNRFGEQARARREVAGLLQSR